MRFARPRKGRGMLAAVAGAAFLLAACSDDPVSPPPNGNDEPDVAGVVITSFVGDTVYLYMDGDEIVPLPLPANQGFGDVGITFLEADGTPADLDNDHSIDIVLGNEDLLSWQVTSGPAATPPHFRLDLETGEPGSSTIQLVLQHGDHFDWESPDVPLIIAAPNGENGENGEGGDD